MIPTSLGASSRHSLTSKLHHWSQETDRMGADRNLLVRDKFSLPVYCLVVRWLVVDLLMYREQRMTVPQNGIVPPAGKPQGTIYAVVSSADLCGSLPWTGHCFGRHICSLLAQLSFADHCFGRLFCQFSAQPFSHPS